MRWASWVREMEQDAVAVAFPDWEWRDDDVVQVGQTFDDGWDPTYSNGPASFETYVSVMRADGRRDPLGVGRWDQVQVHRDYRNEEAAEFWVALMKKGSER